MFFDILFCFCSLGNSNSILYSTKICKFYLFTRKIFTFLKKTIFIIDIQLIITVVITGFEYIPPLQLGQTSVYSTSHEPAEGSS